MAYTALAVPLNAQAKGLQESNMVHSYDKHTKVAPVHLSQLGLEAFTKTAVEQ